MEKVIEALQKRCNALLENPTGTCKTLRLLCATLAWRKSLGGFSTGSGQRKSQFSGNQSDVGSSQSQASNLPTIIYTSQTHSQLLQVFQELRRSNYRSVLIVSLKRQKLYCTHFPRVADYMKNNPHSGDEPLDIEDFVNIGRKFGPRPYYVSLELHKVKEKLNPAEYKEFLGFMKAMKSKVMKIGNVLQCIVGLFSGPEMLPLQERFKDFVPTKYHSLYE